MAYLTLSYDLPIQDDLLSDSQLAGQHLSPGQVTQVKFLSFPVSITHDPTAIFPLAVEHLLDSLTVTVHYTER